MTLAKRIRPGGQPSQPSQPDGSGRDDDRTTRYRSPLRQERAADTRRRITTAALELFGRHGFAGATVASIAEAAGVAPQTVYATFGSKGAILSALLAQLEEDADTSGWRERITAAADPRHKLEAFACWSVAMLSTSKQAIAAAQGAAGDPAIIQLKAEADRHRREALDALVSQLHRDGVLQPQLSQSRAVDRAWLLTGVELYLPATDSCGWADAEYADWLSELLVSQLLARRS